MRLPLPGPAPPGEFRIAGSKKSSPPPATTGKFKEILSTPAQTQATLGGGTWGLCKPKTGLGGCGRQPRGTENSRVHPHPANPDAPCPLRPLWVSGSLRLPSQPTRHLALPCPALQPIEPLTPEGLLGAGRT